MIAAHSQPSDGAPSGCDRYSCACSGTARSAKCSASPWSARSSSRQAPSAYCISFPELGSKETKLIRSQTSLIYRASSVKRCAYWSNSELSLEIAKYSALFIRQG